jgi:hypothetical protein
MLENSQPLVRAPPLEIQPYGVFIPKGHKKIRGISSDLSGLFGFSYLFFKLK